MAAPKFEYWTVWYPKAAATGLLPGRALIATTNQVLLHAAPEVITVEVSDEYGQRLAFGQDLRQTASTPMCWLRRRGTRVSREDLWPGPNELGGVVLLPGGEAGILQQWWHAADRKSWRWQVEFRNTLR